jgi:MFS family permease
MISASRPRSPVGEFRAPTPTKPADGLYGPSFWQTYGSYLLLCTATSLLYRYADLVTILGGTEYNVGLIVGIGMVGSIATRLWIGSSIDQHGPRRVWVGSLVVLAISALAHLGIQDCMGWPIFFWRVVFSTAVAGAVSGAMTSVSARASTGRMAELMAMLGTSGFFGMIFGTVLGDALMGSTTVTRWQVDEMFIAVALLSCAAIPLTWLASRGPSERVVERRPSAVYLVKRYHPGTLLFVAAVTGASLSIPATFLRTYAAELNIPRIGMFFNVCAVVAIVARFLTRRLPQRIGLAPVIVIGLAVMAVTQFLFLPVSVEWHLLMPAAVFGIAQAVLFPMVTAAGGASFPLRYRGLGITLILATMDIGQLIGAPAAGAILEYSGKLGLPGYPTMFVAMAIALIAAGAMYAAETWPMARRAEESTSSACGLARHAVRAEAECTKG